jgi:hypothetical protein
MDKKIVESHRDGGQAILILGTAVIFFGLLGTFIIFDIAPEYELTKRIPLTLLGLGLCLFSLLSLRHYLKEAPKIVISTSRITVKSVFRSVEIPLADIQDVGLRQKAPMMFIFMRVPMESTIIKSKKTRRSRSLGPLLREHKQDKIHNREDCRKGQKWGLEL